MSRRNRPEKPEVEYDFSPLGDHLDLADAMQRLNGKQHVLGRLFKTFSTRYQNAQVEFDQPLVEERWADLKDKVHQLKGASANLSLVTLAALARSIEAELKKERPDSEALTPMIASLHQLMEEVLSRIEVVLSGATTVRQPTSVPPYAALEVSSNRPKVLVVDDVPENVEVLRTILQDDYQVLTATDGTRGLELAASELPDLVLLDVTMSDMHGYDVCRALHARFATENTPVIFVTSLEESHDEAKGFEVGGVDYITKPVNPIVVRARVGTHIKLKRQADALRRLSSLDGLTGIANRRRFDELLGVNWSRCSRSGGPLALMILDVDFFKQYNDSYGHQMGDECLRAIAGVLTSHTNRIDDLAARYGGEEFVCLLPHTPVEGALTVTRSILASISELGLPHRASKVSDMVTASAGVAVAEQFRGESPQGLLKRADLALYWAKSNGRNQVRVHSEVTAKEMFGND